VSLYNFHRVLITASILFDFFFTWWSLRRYFDTSDVTQLVMAIASTVVTVALVVYLVYFNRNLAVLRHALRGGEGGKLATSSPGDNGHK
jgi:hypothetical protein